MSLIDNPWTCGRYYRMAALALIGYWLILLTATHWPLEFIPEAKRFLSRDKLLHGSAYTVLAFLMTLAAGLRRAERGRYPLSRWWPTVGVILIGSASGLLDEATQPLVGRDFEWYDWIADSIGCVCGAVVATLVLRIVFSSASATEDTSATYETGATPQR